MLQEGKAWCDSFFLLEHSLKSSLPTCDVNLAALILGIAGFLGEVFLLCLKNTNTHFRDTIKIDESQVSQCARWTMHCFLEIDLQDKGSSPPSQFGCGCCKRAHPQEEFGGGDGNVNYGIERLHLIEICHLKARYCWRYIPKILNYTTPQQTIKDQWIMVMFLICIHCHERSSRHENGDWKCPVCQEKYEVCRFGRELRYERHGPERPLEDYANVRFVRRYYQDLRLEIPEDAQTKNPRSSGS